MLPPTEPPTTTPHNCAVKKAAVARDRMRTGNERPIRLTAIGMKNASVIPNNTRAPSNSPGEDASPVAIVTQLQRIREATASHFRENRSLSLPANGEAIPVDQINTDPVSPS